MVLGAYDYFYKLTNSDYDTNKCFFCNEETESTRYMFSQCPKEL